MATHEEVKKESWHATNWVIFTAFGEGASLAKKLQEEGKKVVLAIVDDLRLCGSKEKEKPEEKKLRMSNFDGLVKKTTAERMLKVLAKVPTDERDGFFLFHDLNCLYKFATASVKMGYRRGNFPTKEDFSMEEDREKSKEIVKANYPELTVAPVHEFKSVEDAKQFLAEDKGGFFVLKGNSDEAKTVVPVSRDSETCKEQILSRLERDKTAYEAKGFILEVRIPSPLEYTPQAVFVDGELVFIDVDIENKPIGSGNLGYQVGAAQTLVCQVGKDSALARMAFPPFIHELAKKRKGIFTFDASILEDRKTGRRYFGEFCFDPETEMLTREGWKNYKEIKVGDEALSINPMSRKIEWKPVTRKVVLRYDGEMVKLGGDGFAMDALVTPEHHFWIGGMNGPMKRCRAAALPKTSVKMIPRTGLWEGNFVPEIKLNEITVIVPEREVKKGVWSKTDGKKVMTHSGERSYDVKLSKVRSFVRHVLPAQTYATREFCFLLGVWLAEGSFGSYHKGEPRTIVIAQSLKSSRRDVIEKNLRALGIKYGVGKNGTFVINNRRLAKYFWDELGLKETHALTKFIPSSFKELDVESLKKIFEGFAVGDGSFNKNQWSVFTVSKRLIDDLQEIVHKIGWVGNVIKRNSKGTMMTINGKTYFRNHDIYTLSVRYKKTNYSLHPRNRSREDYHGEVWDVSVADNESLFVRRNGKAFFSSNCSNRFGWDSMFAELSMSRSVSGFFEDIMNKKNPLIREYGVAIRVFNLPAYPKDKLGGKDITVRSDTNLWLMDARMENQDLVTTGSGSDAAVATGYGKEPEEAAHMAFDEVEQYGLLDAYYRPQFDFLGCYPTSIMERLKAVRPLKEDLPKENRP